MLLDFSSEHSAVLLTLDAKTTEIKLSPSLTSGDVKLNLFQEIVETNLNPQPSLVTPAVYSWKKL